MSLYIISIDQKKNLIDSKLFATVCEYNNVQHIQSISQYFRSRKCERGEESGRLIPAAQLPIVALRDIQSQCTDRLTTCHFYIHPFCDLQIINFLIFFL